MTWLIAVAAPAVVIGSGGTVLLRGDGPALKALCRRARARLGRLACDRLDRWFPPAGHHHAMTPGAAAAAGGTRHDPAQAEAPEADATTREPSGGAAALPRTGPGSPVPPGPGQRSQGQPVYWHRGDGSVVVIGYGPKAEIPRPSVNLRVTGAHVIVPDTAPLVSRRYSAFEARRDSAVNL